MELTPKAREYLEKEGVQGKCKGRGGVKHLYWQHKICKLYRSKGYRADVEVPIDDVFLDVFAADREGRRTGIQVVTGELDSHEYVGIRKAVLAGLDEVIVLCEEQTVAEAIAERLPEELSDMGWETVNVLVLKDFERANS